MELTCKNCTRLTLLAVLFQIIGLILFVLGFFPVKPALKGISGIEDLKSACRGSGDQMSISFPNSVYREESGVHPQYDRLVIMVIDGLPAEFVLGKGKSPPSREKLEAMPFTHSLLSTGRAIGYHAKAAPPTVTMPRLKAMISGAIAGFLDVAFNFNTQALLDDNIIGQLKTAGWQILMYGDETWLRLFPKSFVRHDGVSSFYVKDTVEVDENVTRHLDAELRTADWDLLILHYLGLDHVGHLGGRASPFMHVKLMEMDMVIQRVYASLISNSTSADRNTLLLVASDHGMTDGGNHGGASFQETDAVALFLADQNFQLFLGTYNDEAFQVDLAPTLALLLGVPIPRNSVGVLLPDLFSNLTVVEKLRALELNSWQLMKLLQVRSSKSSCISSICLSQAHTDFWQGESDENDLLRICSLFRTSKELHQHWKQQQSCSYKEDDGSINVRWQTVAEEYILFLKAASSWLARGTSEKNMLFIYLGGVFMLLASAILLWTWVAICKILTQLSGSGSKFADSLENFIAFGGVCMYLVSFGSSSLVEEEQFTWHFLVITLFFILIRHTFQLRSLQPIHDWNLTLSPFWTLELFCASNKCDKGFIMNKIQTRSKMSTSDKGKIMAQLCAISVVMITGRLLRCWHRSGVNWSHLPDVAKWIDQADPAIVVMIRVISMIFVTALSCIVVLEWTPRHFLQRLIVVNMIIAAMLILLYVLRTDNNTARLSDYWSTLSAQLVYAILGCTALLALLVSPHLVQQYWLVCMGEAKMNMDQPWKKEYLLFLGFRARELACLNFIGRVFISCWCLLQMLLQQSVNTGPFGLLLLQLLAILVFFNNAGSVHSTWLKILTLFWLGASGHYGLGNTNTLATVDVAGAYIGLRSHSILLSGLLAFMITYASPLLYMLGLPLIASLLGGNSIHPCEKDDYQKKQSEHWLFEVIGIPCLVPLALNSLVLVAFTVVMFLMQDHLFVWSVFSPKYLYVCANTFCTYVGVLIYMTAWLYIGVVIKKLNVPDSRKSNQ